MRARFIPAALPSRSVGRQEFLRGGNKRRSAAVFPHSGSFSAAKTEEKTHAADVTSRAPVVGRRRGRLWIAEEPESRPPRLRRAARADDRVPQVQGRSGRRDRDL